MGNSVKGEAAGGRSGGVGGPSPTEAAVTGRRLVVLDQVLTRWPRPLPCSGLAGWVGGWGGVCETVHRSRPGWLHFGSP